MWRTVQKLQEIYGFVFPKNDFGISAEWVFFATSYCKSPCDGIEGTVKQHAAKWNVQTSLKNRILDYKAMLDLFENEMMSIKFFGICKDSMISVENLGKWCEGGDTVPDTRNSHHFVPLSSSRIGHKLTSEDKSYVGIHNLNVTALFETGDISLSAYFTCIYNSWVGMVSLVDIAAADVINIDFMHPHGPRKTFN